MLKFSVVRLSLHFPVFAGKYYEDPFLCVPPITQGLPLSNIFAILKSLSPLKYAKMLPKGIKKVNLFVIVVTTAIKTDIST